MVLAVLRRTTCSLLQNHSSCGPHPFEWVPSGGLEGLEQKPLNCYSCELPLFLLHSSNVLLRKSLRPILRGLLCGREALCVLFPQLYHFSEKRLYLAANILASSLLSSSPSVGPRHPLANGETLLVVGLWKASFTILYCKNKFCHLLITCPSCTNTNTFHWLTSEFSLLPSCISLHNRGLTTFSLILG